MRLYNKLSLSAHSTNVHTAACQCDSYAQSILNQSLTNHVGIVGKYDNTF